MGLIGSLDDEPDQLGNDWDAITTMLQVMPGTNVIKTQEDMIECVREFICSNTKLTVLN